MSDDEAKAAAKREAAQAKIEALTKDVSAYLARHDHKNPDLTVNPIDLLRTVDEVIEYYDAEIERLELLVETYKDSENDQIVKLQLRLGEHDVLKEKLNRVPWIKELLANAQ